MADPADQTGDTDDDSNPLPTLAEATAILTAPGQTFEMEEVSLRGIPTRTWKTAPATLRNVLELSALHGDKDFLVYEDERLHLRRALPHRRRPGPRPGRPVRDHQGRPGGHRHAQPARVGHGLLGHHRRRGRGRAPQRLVDGSRAGLRPERLGHARWRSWTRSAGTGSSPTSARSPTCGAMIVCCEQPDAGGGRRVATGSTVDRGTGRDPLPVVPFAERRRACPADADPPRGGHRARRRRHHLLHLRHHRSAQGGGGHPPQQRVQPDEPVLRVHRGHAAPDGARSSRRAAGPRTPTSCRSPSSTPPAATPCW